MSKFIVIIFIISLQACSHTKNDRIISTKYKDKTIIQIMKLHGKYETDIGFSGDPPCTLKTVIINISEETYLEMEPRRLPDSIRFSDTCSWNLDVYSNLKPIRIYKIIGSKRLKIHG